MQDLNAEICKRSKTQETRILMDKRDWKSYWVAKLADGNCWMVQNLDYDIPESELPGVIRYDSTTGLNPEGMGWPINTNRDEMPRYYDPGYYYYINTTSWENCHNVSDGLMNATCETAGWKTTGDAHFSVGNFYNWYAVTKGSGKNNTVGEAGNSICPAGWILPRGNTDKSGSFGTALPENGDPSDDDFSLAGVYKWTNNDNTSTGAPSLRVAPYYFVPSGHIHSGTLRNAGDNANYWSSTTSGNGWVYYLTFAPTTINPVRNSHAAYGFPARCLVLGS